jgi:adenylate cyclase
MWQVAVFRPGQHEQFQIAGERFVMSRSASDRCWTLRQGDARPLTATAIRGRIDRERLWIETHGVDEPIVVADGTTCDAREVFALPLPCIFRIGDAWFEIRPVAAESSLRLEPLHVVHVGVSADATPLGPDAETVAEWLTSVSRLHRTAASAPEFFVTAAQLTLKCTGLDSAMILLKDPDGQWQIAGSAIEHPQHGVSFESSALALIMRGPEVWRCPRARPAAEENDPSPRESIVVAPICDDRGGGVAAIYGVRHGLGDNRRRGIRPLEARVVELMADAVGAGIARRRQEVESARQHVLLEQAFSPVVVEQVLRHPLALSSQTREVTMLFADLRGSTALAHELASADVCDLLSELLEVLTQAVIDHAGVVIDYYGDGLCAMWNAPLDVLDHADLACRAALDMLVKLPDLSRRWHGRVGQSLALGVGLHAGEVQVGNAGTRRRLKYGPRGAAVNMAHRVQLATKTLDVPLLVTHAVRRRLSSRFVTLKACTARLPGLEQPLDLFTVFPSTDGARMQTAFDRYAEALAAFEGGDLDSAERLLEKLLAEGQVTPAAFLAQQTKALRQTALGRRATDQLAYTPDAVIEILAK